MIVSALLAGTFLFGTVYAQDPANNPQVKPVAKKEAVVSKKSDSKAPVKSHGKGKAKTKKNAVKTAGAKVAGTK